MPRLRLLSLLLLPVLALAGCSGSPSDTTTSGIVTIPIGDREPAPELTGELLGGGTYSLAEHAGEVVVVNFWGSWCGPCVAEADDLEATYKSTKDSRVSFIGVNVRDDKDKALRFAELRSTYPSIFDPSSRLAIGFKVPPTATPTTIVLDRQGRVAATAFGPIQQATLEPVVASLAAESP
jgi:thiol-disulfide isomerase/thioredoxin